MAEVVFSNYQQQARRLRVVTTRLENMSRNQFKKAILFT